MRIVNVRPSAEKAGNPVHAGIACGSPVTDQPARIGWSNVHTSTRSPLSTTAPSAGEDAMSLGPTGAFPAAGAPASARIVYRHMEGVMAASVDDGAAYTGRNYGLRQE